ncbi:MAG TPA: DUF72 domain-containing protein [Labilithrix sp.]|nr:DUF72 domain-containing protein [Labilithrix sp.]
MPGLVKVGVTSWTEPSLLASSWYPKDVHTAEERLRYYANQFPIVENDSTYYAVPAPQKVQLWADRTPEGFTMNVKVFASLTGHYTDPKRLPPDLRSALSPAIREKRRVYPKDLGEEITEELTKRFIEALEPLRVSGRLGVVLFQYPVWFPCSPENRERLVAMAGRWDGIRVAVEFRNATWMDDRHRERTLSLLCEAGLAYTCVDEPQGFPSSVPPVAVATSDLALVRFHGRSAVRWNRSSSSAAERFRYRYSAGELREWVPAIRALADETDSVHVLMNNCYSNYAVTNARQLAELLDEAPVRGARAPSLPTERRVSAPDLVRVESPAAMR